MADSSGAPSKIIVRKPTAEEADEANKWGEWEKAPSTFAWSYSEKETCLILEGSATVSADDGSQSAHFGSGDWVVFPVGLKCKWKIEKKIRKKYKVG